MSGLQLFLIAAVIFMIGRWAQDETALSVKIVASVVFGSFTFAIMDGTGAAHFAQMFAALILLVACLKAISIKGIANAITGATKTTEVFSGGAASQDQAVSNVQLDASYAPDAVNNLYVTSGSTTAPPPVVT